MDEKLVKKEDRRDYSPTNIMNRAMIGYVNLGDESAKVKQVSCGYEHTVCILENGDLLSWGNNKNGQLGHGNQDESPLPKKIECNFKAEKVMCGAGYTIVQATNGKLYAFGDNRMG